MSIYKFEGKKGRMYAYDEESIKQNANCPDSEKSGTGPGSCGGAKNKSSKKSVGMHSIAKGGPQSPNDVLKKVDSTKSAINSVNNAGKTEEEVYDQRINNKRSEARYAAGKISPEDFYEQYKSAFGGNLPYITIPNHPDGKNISFSKDDIVTTEHNGQLIEGKIYGFIKDYDRNKMVAQLEVGNGSMNVDLDKISGKFNNRKK